MQYNTEKRPRKDEYKGRRQKDIGNGMSYERRCEVDCFSSSDCVMDLLLLVVN